MTNSRTYIARIKIYNGDDSDHWNTFKVGIINARENDDGLDTLFLKEVKPHVPSLWERLLMRWSFITILLGVFALAISAALSEEVYNLVFGIFLMSLSIFLLWVGLDIFKAWFKLIGESAR